MTGMVESAERLADRLTLASRRNTWDVYSDLEWPEALDPAFWPMSPELVSLHGTPTWDALDEAGQRRLALFDLGAFFSITLHGERPLIQGLAGRLYMGPSQELTPYLHHFLDEENKHMVMFSMFCERYIGRVYPEKKLPFNQKFPAAEEEIRFFIKALVVEELGDYYNVVLARDERVDPLVREVNKLHHIDEARHLAFGRRHLRELCERHLPGFDAEQREGLATWIGQYLRGSWADFYNPMAYKDAGLPDPYGARKHALSAAACRAHRDRASEKLVGLLLDLGLIAEPPEV